MNHAEDFTHDALLMYDFYILNKYRFLATYPEVTGAEYEATVQAVTVNWKKS